MPNHFHFIIQANEKSIIPRIAGKLEIQELSYRIGILLSSYSQIINKQNGTTGSLFQQRTKAKDLTALRKDPKKAVNTYLIYCIHYVHQNAWKAGLVNRIEDWKYSSFPDYCGFRNGTLCNKSLLLELTGYDMNNFYQESYKTVPDIIIKNISC